MGTRSPRIVRQHDQIFAVEPNQLAIEPRRREIGHSLGERRLGDRPGVFDEETQDARQDTPVSGNATTSLSPSPPAIDEVLSGEDLTHLVARRFSVPRCRGPTSRGGGSRPAR